MPPRERQNRILSSKEFKPGEGTACESPKVTDWSQEIDGKWSVLPYILAYIWDAKGTPIMFNTLSIWIIFCYRWMEHGGI